MLVDSLISAGFTAVHADIILEDDLNRYIHWVKARPLRVVVLAPDPKVVAQRELRRGSDAYRNWMASGQELEDAVRDFHSAIESTPKIGLWIDSSHQTPEETLREILDRWDEGIVE